MNQEDIKKLPDDIKNRLRSDIQINTVTQCVIELVFNSLDAKATSIGVRLNLKKHKIQVVDNGEGILYQNFKNLGLRYMTNKYRPITEFEKKRNTYGFKGESLCSVIAVSRRVEITSKFGDRETYSKVFLNGEVESVLKVKDRCNVGTTVTTENFLYNCPVRQNRTKPIDMNYIKKLLEQLSVICFDVSFSLRNDETGDIIMSNRKEKSISHILCNLNTDLDIKKFSEIKVFKGDTHIRSMFYMTSTSITDMQYLYINKFPVCLDKLQKFIKKSLRGSLDDIFLSEHAYPVYVMYIRCPPSEVDIYFESSKFVADFKSWKIVERCVEKMIKLYVKKYLKQRESQLTQSTGKSIEIEGEKPFEDDSEILETVVNPKKRKKTLGIKLGFSQMIKSDNVRKTLNKLPFQLNDSPKSSKKITENFFSIENLILQSKHNVKLPNCVEENEQNGKKIIMDTFMKSLPASEELPEICSENNDKFEERIFNDNMSQSHKNSSESDIEKDISFCIKLQGNEKRKRRSEMLNTMGTNLIEKKLKLRGSAGDDGKILKVFNYNEMPLTQIFDEYNLFDSQKDSNKYVNKATSPLTITKKTVASQTETSTKFKKYKTVATSPIDFEKRNKMSFDLKSKSKTFEYIPHVVSPLRESDMSFLESCWKNKAVSNSKKRTGDKENLFTTEIKQRGNTEWFFDEQRENDFPFTYTSKNKDVEVVDEPETLDPNVTFKSHYFETSRPKRSKKSLNEKCDNVNQIEQNKKRDTKFEMNTEKLFDLTFQSGFLKRRQEIDLPSTELLNIQSSNDHLNTSKYFCKTSKVISKQRTKPLIRSEQKATSFLDTSSFYFQTPIKRILKKLDEEVDTESIVTFRHFEPTNKSTQIEEKNKEKNNFFDSFLFEGDKNVKENNDFIDKAQGFEENLFESDFLHKKQENLFTMKKRIDFVPKGLSPILKETKTLDVTLSPNSKRNLNNAIIKSFEEELHLVKWTDYLDKDSPKEFFEKLYSEKQKNYEKNIPMYKQSFNMDGEKAFFDKNKFTSIDVVGQVDCKFIVATSNSNLLVFDQHAVHERVRLEYLYKEYTIKDRTKNTVFKSTNINQHIKIRFSDSEIAFLNEYKNVFDEFGFEYKIYSPFVVIAKIPLCLQRKKSQNQSDEDFPNLIESLLKEEIVVLQETNGIRSSSPRLLQYIISTEACRGAIKFGQRLSNEECKTHIDMLFKCQLPFQCAHGRPTIYPLLTLKHSKNDKFKINFKKLL